MYATSVAGSITGVAGDPDLRRQVAAADFARFPRVAEERRRPLLVAGRGLQAVDPVVLGRDEQRVFVEQRLGVDLAFDVRRPLLAEGAAADESPA